jgi:hypothetical protein
MQVGDARVETRIAVRVVREECPQGLLLSCHHVGDSRHSFRFAHRGVHRHDRVHASSIILLILPESAAAVRFRSSARQLSVGARSARSGHAFGTIHREGEEGDMPAFKDIGEPERGFAVASKGTCNEMQKNANGENRQFEAGRTKSVGQ